jgi:hypothetical protein
MSRKKPVDAASLDAVLRQMQKAEAVLACIQFTALYDNEAEADLADAIEVALELVTAAAVSLDTAATGGGAEDD